MKTWREILPRLLHEIGVPDAECRIDEFGDEYSDPSRKYHTLTHIDHLLSQLFAARSEPSFALLFAALYHDFVYDTARPDNEEQSAIAAGKILKSAGVNDAIIEEVKLMICATKHSGDASNLSEDCKLLLDADMSILASSPARYATYIQEVRQEYAQVSDSLWRHHRLRFLLRCLQSTAIFYSEHFKASEASARINIGSEVLQLVTEYEELVSTLGPNRTA